MFTIDAQRYESWKENENIAGITVVETHFERPKEMPDGWRPWFLGQNGNNATILGTIMDGKAVVSTFWSQPNSDSSLHIDAI